MPQRPQRFAFVFGQAVQSRGKFNFFEHATAPNDVGASLHSQAQGTAKKPRGKPVVLVIGALEV